MMRVELAAADRGEGGKFEFDVAWSLPGAAAGLPPLRHDGDLEGHGVGDRPVVPRGRVYDDVHGWNTLPYLGTGEFYMNFGNVRSRDHGAARSPRRRDGRAAEPRRGLHDDAARAPRRGAGSARPDTVVIRGQDEVGDPRRRPAGDGPLTWRFRAENVRTVAWASSSEAFILDACTSGTLLVQSAY
jgi:hypothetical protein